jgi:hypothetical protein
MPDNATNAVEAAEGWTPQEKFVWERVAAGEFADFNTAEGYGGYRDPKKPEGWPDNRVLRSVFLETILLKDLYRRALTRRGVTISGARFTDAIELQGAELQHRFGLADCLIEKGADLSGLRSKYPITLSRSKVAGTLWANGIDLDASLLIRNAEFAEMDFATAHVGGQLILSGSKVAGKLNMGALQTGDYLGMDKAEFAEIDLTNAHIGGILSLINSKVAGKLNMNGMRVERSLTMSTKAEFTEVELTGAYIGGVLNFNGSKVTAKLNMNGLHIEQSLFMRDNAEFAEVDLTGAHIGGQLSLNGSKVTGYLNMNSLRVEQNLFMTGNAEFAEINLAGAHIGEQLELSGAKVTGKLNMDSLDVKQHLFMSDKAEFAEVELTSAHIGGQLSLTDSKVNGTLYCDSVEVGLSVFLSQGATFLGPINLNFAKIGQNLQLAGGAFDKQVDMTGARIGGQFLLGSWPDLRAKWKVDTALILRNASVDTIQDMSDAWPDHLDLNGFNYQRPGGIYATKDKPECASENEPQDPTKNKPEPERLVGWFEDWLARQERYAAQPYDQLASRLKSNGKSEMATAIRYAGSERERKESSGWWRYTWLTIFKWSVGYGYRPWRALGWTAGLVLLGAVILCISGEGSRNHMPWGLAYSFDMLLPIVKLREWHYQVDLMGWARYYFYAHKIMGYLLASFLIAGLSGLSAGNRE